MDFFGLNFGPIPAQAKFANFGPSYGELGVIDDAESVFGIYFQLLQCIVSYPSCQKCILD